MDSNSIAILPKKLFPDKALQLLIDTAIQYNADIRIAVQRIAAARAGVGIAQGLTKPGLDAVVSTGVDKFGDYTMNGLGNYDVNLSSNIRKDQQIPLNMPDFFLGFRSTWEDDIWGKLSNQKKPLTVNSLQLNKQDSGLPHNSLHKLLIYIMNY